MPLLSTVVDSFAGAALNNIWTAGSTGTGTSTVGGGTLNLSGTASGALGRIYSTGYYTFSNTVSIFARIDLGTSNATSVQFGVWGVTNEQLAATISAGQLTCTLVDSAGATAFTQSVTYDPLAMAYVRIRNGGTTVYLDTSRDAITWTTTITSTFYGPGGGDIYRPFMIAQWTGVTPNGNPVKFDDCNIGAFDKFTEEFPGVALDTAKWNTPTFSGATVTVADGLLKFTGTSGGNATVTSIGRTFTDSYVYAKIDIGASAGVSSVTFQVSPVAGGNEKIYAGLNAARQLYLYVFSSAGATIASSSVPYVAETMVLWRLRHSSVGNVIELHTSANGLTWTLQLSTSMAVSATAFHRLTLQVTWSGGSSAEPVTFDLINALGGPGPLSITNAESFGLPVLAQSKMETLTDDFAGGVLDPTKWVFNNVGTLSIYQGTVNLAVGGGNVTATVSSLGAFLFTDTYLLCRVFPGATGTSQDRLTVGAAGSSEAFSMVANGSVLNYVGSDPAGAPFHNSSHAWNASQMAWWRIRHTSGVLYWETAPDASTLVWTIRAQANYNPGPGVPYTASFNAYTTSNFNSRFDNVNLVTRPLELLQEDFSGGVLDPTKFKFNNVGTCTVSGGTLNVSSFVASPSVITGIGPYQLANSYIFFRLASLNRSSSNQLDLTVTNEDKERFQFVLRTTGNLACYLYNTSGSVLVNGTQVLWNATTMAWWRIRHTAGVVYWETSPEAVNWTIRAQYTYTPASAYYQVKWNCDHYDNSALNFSIDNVNQYTAVTAPNSIGEVEAFGTPTFYQPKFETLADDFESPQLNAAKWAFTSTGTGTSTGTVSGGRLNLVVPATGGSLTARVSSAVRLSLYESYVFGKVTCTAIGASQFCQMRLVPPTGTELFQFQLGNGTLSWSGTGAGFASLGSGGGDYFAATHAWWRIRHTGGVMYWETSADVRPLAWTIRMQATYTPQAAGMTLELYATNSSGTGAAFTTTFDNINVLATLLPDGINDPETFGDPLLVSTATVNPDGINDPESLGDPTADATATVVPDGINDPENLGDPTVPGFSATVNPGGINDPETLGAPAVAYPPISGLIESFGGTSLDTAWQYDQIGSAISASVSGGHLNFNVVVAASSTYQVNVYSKGYYAFKNSQAFVQVSPITTNSTPATVFGVWGNNGESYYFSKAGTGLAMRAAGGPVLNASISYGAGVNASLAFWRIRHAGTTVYWETSDKDSGPWFVQRQITYTPAGTGYYVNTSVSWTGVTAVASAWMDNVNEYPSYSVIDPETFGPPTALPVGRPMELLQDAFTVDPLDLTKWSPNTAAPGTAVQTGSGQLQVSLSSGRTIPYAAGAYSIESFDLNESYILAKVTTIATASTATQLVVRNPANTKEYFAIYRQGINIYFRGADTNGTLQISSQTAWVASPAMDWWRIRHSAGIVYLETGDNSYGWTVRASIGYTPSTRAMQPSLEATLMSGTSTNVTAYFDNINLGTFPKPLGINDPESFGLPGIAFVSTAVTHNNMALL